MPLAPLPLAPKPLAHAADADPPQSEREREARVVEHLQTDHAAAKRLSLAYAEQLRSVLRVADERQLEIRDLREALDSCQAKLNRALYQMTQQQLETEDLRATLSSQRAKVCLGQARGWQARLGVATHAVWPTDRPAPGLDAAHPA